MPPPTTTTTATATASSSSSSRSSMYGSAAACISLVYLTGQAEDAARFPGQNVTSRSRGSRSSVIITSQPYIARARGQARPGCCRAAASNTHRIMALWASSRRERNKSPKNSRQCGGMGERGGGGGGGGSRGVFSSSARGRTSVACSERRDFHEKGYGQINGRGKRKRRDPLDTRTYLSQHETRKEKQCIYHTCPLC